MTTFGSAQATGWRHRWALSTECVLVGIYIVVAALPLITIPAALVAGVEYLRRWSAGEDANLVHFGRTFGQAIRTLWRHGLLWLAVTAVLVLDITLAVLGPLPMADPILVLLIGLLLFVQVILLRMAASTVPFREVVLLCVRDWSGSVLLAAAVVMATVAAWQVLPLVVPALGLLALAAEATRVRHEGGQGKGVR